MKKFTAMALTAVFASAFVTQGLASQIAEEEGNTRTINLGSQNTGTLVFKGFGGGEGGHRWTSATKASIKGLSLNEGNRRVVHVQLSAFPYADDAHPQTLEVFFNGDRIGALQKHTTADAFNIDIDTLLEDVSPAKIKFLCPNARNPLGDPRTVAFAVTNMVLTFKDVVPAAADTSTVILTGGSLLSDDEDAGKKPAIDSGDELDVDGLVRAFNLGATSGSSTGAGKKPAAVTNLAASGVFPADDDSSSTEEDATATHGSGTTPADTSVPPLSSSFLDWDLDDLLAPPASNPSATGNVSTTGGDASGSSSPQDKSPASSPRSSVTIPAAATLTADDSDASADEEVSKKDVLKAAGTIIADETKKTAKSAVAETKKAAEPVVKKGANAAKKLGKKARRNAKKAGNKW